MVLSCACRRCGSPDAKRNLDPAAGSIAFCFLSTASPDSVTLLSANQPSPNRRLLAIIAPPRSRANPVIRSPEKKMSFKLMIRRLVMAFVLGGYSVLGIGMSREKIESLMHAMNQSNVELSTSNADGEGDTTRTFTDASEDSP